MHPSSGVLAVALAALGACTSGPSEPSYDPVLPTSWAPAVTNPWFPLTAGSLATYQAQAKTGLETNTVEVLANPRMVNGVSATEVWDRVYVDGELTEETYDWYAQDGDGNVWYLGEDTKEYDNGMVVSTRGSWEWGVKGALPGIIMWADPATHLDEAYRQEFLQGTAEDWGKVIALNAAVTVPAGSFTGCVQTEDWNGLESGREYKYYCSGFGVTLEVGKRGTGTRTELISRVVP